MKVLSGMLARTAPQIQWSPALLILMIRMVRQENVSMQMNQPAAHITAITGLMKQRLIHLKAL